MLPTRRMTTRTNGFKMAFDGLLMRGFGFCGVPACFELAPILLSFTASGFPAFHGFTGFEKAIKSHQKPFCGFPDVASVSNGSLPQTEYSCCVSALCCRWQSVADKQRRRLPSPRNDSSILGSTAGAKLEFKLSKRLPLKCIFETEGEYHHMP